MAAAPYAILTPPIAGNGGRTCPPIARRARTGRMMAMSELRDLTGKKFGRLTVLELAMRGSRGTKWLCRCDCGNETVVFGGNLTRGNTLSCGCLRYERLREGITSHGLSGSRLHSIWCGMRKRCNNPKAMRYERYGGRGITICDEWLDDFAAFHAWAMANGYRDDLSIDRIDNDGDYEPGNCRWITLSENTRRMNEHRWPKAVTSCAS